jgi:lysophospholipase
VILNRIAWQLPSAANQLILLGKQAKKIWDFRLFQKRQNKGRINMRYRASIAVGISIAFFSCKQTGSDVSTFREPKSEVRANYQFSAMSPKWAKVREFFATGVQSTFDGEAGVKIAHIKFDQDKSRSIVVIVSGMSENYFKYQEFIYDLDQAGYSIYLMDNRGMGSSGREIENHQLIHIEDVEDYHRDFSKYVHDVLPSDGRPKYLFTHSTGGYIATQFAATYPTYFAKIMLSAPLFKIKMDAPGFVTDFVLWTRIARGLGKRPARGEAIFDPNAADFNENRVTHSKERFDEDVRMLLEHPETVMSQPTNDWVKKISHALSYTWIKATASAIHVPIFILQAGKDTYVDTGVQDKFCAVAPNCQMHRFDNSFHELYREVDEIRTPCLEKIREFFQP